MGQFSDHKHGETWPRCDSHQDINPIPDSSVIKIILPYIPAAEAPSFLISAQILSPAYSNIHMYVHVRQESGTYNTTDAKRLGVTYCGNFSPLGTNLIGSYNFFRNCWGWSWGFWDYGLTIAHCDFTIKKINYHWVGHGVNIRIFRLWLWANS